MSTLRTNALQTLDNLFTIDVNDIASIESVEEVEEVTKGYYINISKFNAVGDGRRYLGSSITSGTNTLSNTNSPFVSTDVGKIIHIKGAGVAGAGLLATITGFISPTSVTLSLNASTTVTNAETVYGTDNTTFIQNAINFCESNLVLTELLSTPPSLVIPVGFFVTNGTLTVTEAIRIFGFGKSSHICNIGIGSDALTYSNTKFIQAGGIKDVFLSSWTDSGHVINLKYGVAFSSFKDLVLFAGNPAKSCIFADHTSFGGGSYDCEFSGGWYNGTRVGRTVPIIDVTANGTLWNEQVIRNLRIEGAEGTQAIRIKNVGAGTYLVNNRYENLNFEICAGGGIYIESHRNYTIANISFWDNPTYTGDLISLGNGAGFATAAGVLMNIQRHGSVLSGGAVDIHFTNSNDANLIGFNTLAGTGPIINFNNRRVNVFGRVEGTLQNTAAISRFDALDGIHLQDALIKSGTGSPEGVVTAGRGSLFLRKDGGANTSLYVKESGTGNTGWAAYMKAPLTGSVVYDPPSLADGAGVNTTLTVTGAFSGDGVIVSFSNNLSGITLTGYVSSTDTVTARFQNESGGVLDLGSGTLRAWVIKA